MAELLLGLGFGLGAGLSPGPMLALAISSSLQRGFYAGLQVALAPLVTDGPIIAITLLLLDALPAPFVVGAAIAGGAFVIYLGFDTVRQARGATIPSRASATSWQDLWRGVGVNFLNPHPWIFWLGVGGPLLRNAWERSPGGAAAFLIGFYSFLIGSKIAVALAVASGRRHLELTWYRRVLIGAGLLLLITGGLFVWHVVTDPPALL